MLIGEILTLYRDTDRSVGMSKCYLSRPPGVKREVWFPAMAAGRAATLGVPARNCLPCPPMPGDTPGDSRQEILRTAAHVLQWRI